MSSVNFVWRKRHVPIFSKLPDSFDRCKRQECCRLASIGNQEERALANRSAALSKGGR